MIDFNVFITGLLKRLYDNADVNGRISWGLAYGTLCPYSHLTPSEVRAILRTVEKKTDLISLSSKSIKIREEKTGAKIKFGLRPVMARVARNHKPIDCQNSLFFTAIEYKPGGLP